MLKSLSNKVAGLKVGDLNKKRLRHRCLFLKLSISLYRIPLLCDLFRKRIDQKKIPFISINNCIVLAVQWSVICFFDPNSLLFWNSGGKKKKKRGNCEAFYFDVSNKIKWITRYSEYLFEKYFWSLIYVCALHIFHQRHWKTFAPTITGLN